jgi:hypothetical protein
VSITHEEAAALPDDELLNFGVAQLATIRAAAIGRGTGFAAFEAIENLDVCVPLLDRITSARFEDEWDAASFGDALDYIKRAALGGAHLVAAEIGIITELPRARVLQLHSRARARLQRLARNRSGSLAISRRGDVERHWSEQSGARRFIAPLIERTPTGYRLLGVNAVNQRRILERVDGLIVLFSNTPADVPPQEYKLSVSIAAGTLP